MKQSIADRLIQSLAKASRHNSQLLLPPRAILWPDPEQQWAAVIAPLQERLPQLLAWGPYEPGLRRGPAIWLKCMIDRSLPQADWPPDRIPIVYLPGISRRDLKNVADAGLALQPLLEYQYTGTLWLHENGKEWTVAAFIQNQAGMGVNVAPDTQTRTALITSLPDLFHDPEALYNRQLVDADFLLARQYPNAGADILKWMEGGEAFLGTLSTSKKQAFIAICQSNYGFTPDLRDIKSIALKLGARKGPWAQVWEYFSHAPARYPQVQQYLRLAKPDDLGSEMFALPRDSWPQENEAAEAQLRDELNGIEKAARPQIGKKLEALAKHHAWRRGAVWSELGQAPLLAALGYLQQMAAVCASPYPSATLDELVGYYATAGYQADLSMRHALAAVQSKADTDAVTRCIRYLYQPWLEAITAKFQERFTQVPAAPAPAMDAPAILFVDALRYDVAEELAAQLEQLGYAVAKGHHLTAIPSLTPTAKPYNSPLAKRIDLDSPIKEFRPVIQGKELTTEAFRKALKEVGYEFVRSPSEIKPGQKYWLEIGTLDAKGHDEQAAMVRRVPEMLQEILECIRGIKEAGISRLSIVTDHGWLLLPGGLPKANITKDLTETRWGRCALIKEGAQVDLPHYAWTWNPSTFIAYAPGISFFKANEEYAHGGISLQECVVPRLEVTLQTSASLQGKIAAVSWNQLICHIELSAAADGCILDIRSRQDDPATSVVLSKPEKRLAKAGKARLMVDDSTQGDAAHVVLSSPEGIILDSQLTTIGR